MTHKPENKLKTKSRMQRKILMYMVIFAAIILSIMWVLQTVFLDDIYKSIKENQIRNDTILISHLSSDKNFEAEVYELATRQNTCISVYKIESGRGKAVINAHSQGHCLIHSAVNDSLISSVYSGAKENGVYTYLVEAENKNFADSIICATITNIDETELLILLNTEIQPVNATVTTLRYLLIWITVLLVIVTVVISYLISKNITRPVSNMNEEAKRLALGNYDVNFDGGEFLETSELAGTLNYAAGELSKLDTMQKELIANISHDLRTPLTMISGYSEVMRDIPGEITAENIQVIIDETARLSSLVSDMLDLSRITGGQRKLNKTIFSLTECVSATLERYNRLRERDGYKFIFDCKENYYVEADEMLILQVIYNLINNAVNYAGEDKTVTVEITEKDGVCRLSVKDNGEGIPPEKLPLIWDRYYKASDFHRRAIKGTGLGLSIVKNALILHGADFGVTSTLGCGSTFWFELKVAEKE
ncbi:MAG: HAMP domain-containing histidine kinase [Clostridia bacterium]|nr:HAMP domain-containing histidine kinase [Clostridia bacterium]